MSSIKTSLANSSGFKSSSGLIGEGLGCCENVGDRGDKSNRERKGDRRVCNITTNGVNGLLVCYKRIRKL